TLPPATLTFLGGKGRVAGPFTTDPSMMENLAPWQPQLMVPPLTSVTRHLWWVHIASKPLYTPADGWVTTILGPSKTKPPPTGIALAGPSGAPVFAPAPAGAASAGAIVAPVNALPMPAAPSAKTHRSRQRRAYSIPGTSLRP